MPNEITRASISFVSLVKKGANREKFFLVKSDAEATYETQSPILAKSEKKQIAYGVVYAPDVVDTQGDFMKAETIEQAAHDYMLKSQAVDKEHTFEVLDGAKIVESYIAPCDMELGGTKIVKGSWVMGTKVTNDEVWQQIKKGEISAYSIGGTGERVKVKEEKKVKKEADELSDNDDFKGFFNLLKSFFTGEKLEKSKKAIVKAKTFAGVMAFNDITEDMWRVNDALHSVMREVINNPEIKDKKPLLNQAIDEYCDYMKKKVSKIGTDITKSEADFFIGEGGNEVKKEEFEEVVKSLVAPISERLEKLEKGDEAENETGKNTELTKSVLESVMKSALDPINERIEKLEKAKGYSKQVDDHGDNAQGIQKTERKYSF